MQWYLLMVLIMIHLDGEPAKLFFMIAAPEGENNLHLDVLARLSMMLMDPEFKDQLINAKSVNEFLESY